MMNQGQEPAISVVIPTLQEEQTLEETLDVVRKLPGVLEVVVVDGGSSDGTVVIAAKRNCRVILTERGRGNQLAEGASAARGTILWFLHADTHPPHNATDLIAKSLADPRVSGGHFCVRFSPTWTGRFTTCIYWCVQYIGLCYGDSAFLVRRDSYDRAGGFRPLPLFEDLDLRRRLCREGRFVRVSGWATTSSRRFEGRSISLTFARWITLQLLYWLGVSPFKLARFYAAIRGAP